MENAFRRMSCGDWEAQALERLNKSLDDVSPKANEKPLYQKKQEKGEDDNFMVNLEQIFEVRDRDKSFDNIDSLLNPKSTKPLPGMKLDVKKLASYGEINFDDMPMENLSFSNQSSMRLSRQSSRRKNQNGSDTPGSSRSNSVNSSNLGHSRPPALPESFLDGLDDYGESAATTTDSESKNDYGPTGFAHHYDRDDESESIADGMRYLLQISLDDVPPLPFNKLSVLQDGSDQEGEYDSDELFENNQPEDMRPQNVPPPRFSDAVYEESSGSEMESENESYSDPVSKDARLKSELVRRVIFNETSQFELFDMFDDDKDGILNESEILYLGYALLAWAFQLRRVHIPLPPFDSEEAKSSVSSVLKKMKTREPKIYGNLDVIEKGRFHHFTGYVHQLFGKHFLPNPARKWTPEEVGRWLRYVGLQKYVRLFLAEEVTGINLLDDIDLRLLELDFDMPKFHAKKLLERIGELREIEESDESDGRDRAMTTTTVTTTDDVPVNNRARMESVGSPVAQLDSQSSYMLNNMSYSKSKGTLIVDSLVSASKGTLNLSAISGVSRRQDSIFNSLTFNDNDSTDFSYDYINKRHAHQSSKHGTQPSSHSTYGSMMSSSEDLADGDETSSVIADVVIIDNFVVASLTLRELWNNFSRENPEKLEKYEVLDMLYSVLAWGYQKVGRPLPRLQDAKPHVKSLMENIRQTKPELFDGLTIPNRDFYHFGDYLKEQYSLLNENQHEDSQEDVSSEPFLNHWLSQVSDVMFTEQDRIDFGVFHSFLLKMNPELLPDDAEKLFKSISKSNGAFLTQENFQQWLKHGNPIQKQLLYKTLNLPAHSAGKPSLDTNLTIDTEQSEYYGDEQRFLFDNSQTLQKKLDHLESVFKRYDPGNRGVIDLEAFKTAWRRLGFGGMFNDIARAFDSIDLENKNEMNLSQFQETILSPAMAKFYPSSPGTSSKISLLSPVTPQLPGLHESKKWGHDETDAEDDYPDPPYRSKNRKASPDSTPRSLPKQASNITVYENGKEDIGLFQSTPKGGRTPSLSWETNPASPTSTRSKQKPEASFLFEPATFFRDFQSCVGIKQIFAMGESDHLNLMQVKLMLAQFRGVTKDEVDAKSVAVSHLKGKTLPELVSFLRTISSSEMQLLRGENPRRKLNSKEKRWNAIILKGNVIGEGVERSGKEFEDRLTNVICNTFKQTLVKNTSWNEGGIEVSLIPGLSKKQLKQYNACLKQSNIEMRVKALQRKHHDVWNEGSELDVFDSYYQSWYAGTVIQCSSSYGAGSEKNEDKGNWLLVEWVDGDKEIWRETLARHGGHLRSRTIQTRSVQGSVAAESSARSHQQQPEPIPAAASPAYMDLFQQKLSPTNLELGIPPAKASEIENDDIPTIPSRRIADFTGPGKFNFEQVEVLPFDSDVEVTTRYAWQAGDAVLVYSFRQQAWLQGQIRIVFHDEEGEWLDCCYFDTAEAMMRHKEVQRFDDQIQPSTSDIRNFPKIGDRANRRLSSTNPSQPFDMQFSTRVLYIDSIDSYLITSEFSKPVLNMIYDVFKKFGMTVLNSDIVESRQVSPLHLKKNSYFKSVKIYLTEAVDSPRMELIWNELRTVMSLFARKITSRVSDLLLSKAATNTCKNIVLRPENAEHYDRHRVQLFEVKVSRIFYKFDQDKDEFLKFEDIAGLHRQVDGTAFTVQQYANLCAKLDAHPKQGMTREQFQVMYKVGLRTLEKDYLSSFGSYPNNPHPEKPTNDSIDYWSILKSRIHVKSFFRGRNKRGEPIVTRSDAADILRQIRQTNYISPDDRAIKILANMTYPIMLKELSCTNSSIVALLEGKEPTSSVYSQPPRALYISGLPSSFGANGKFFLKHSHSSHPVYISNSNSSISISYDSYQGQWIIENKKEDILIAFAKEKVPHPLEIAGLWRVLNSHTNSFVQSGLVQVTQAPVQNNFRHQHQYAMPDRPRAPVPEVHTPQVRPPQVRQQRGPPPPIGFPSTVMTQSTNHNFAQPIVSGPRSGVQPPAPRQYGDDPFNSSQLSEIKHQLQHQNSPQNPPETGYSLQGSHRQSLHSTQSFPTRPPPIQRARQGYTSNKHQNHPGPQYQKRNSAPSRNHYGHRYPTRNTIV